MLFMFNSLTFNFYPLYHSKAFFELYICSAKNGFEMIFCVLKPASSDLKGLIVVRGPGHLTAPPSPPPEHKDTGGPEGTGKHRQPLSWHRGTLLPPRRNSGEGVMETSAHHVTSTADLPAGPACSAVRFRAACPGDTHLSVKGGPGPHAGCWPCQNGAKSELA